jgi:hypothetical protein
MSRVQIRLDEKDKQRWIDHVDETDEYENLSTMIKVVVEREIAREDAQNPLQKMSEVLKSIEKNRSHIQDVINIVERIENKQAEDEDINKLYRNLMDLNLDEDVENVGELPYEEQLPDAGEMMTADIDIDDDDE